MSALLANSALRKLALIVIIIGVFRTISELIGLDALMHATPGALTVIRILAILLFGTLGISSLFFPDRKNPQIRPMFYRAMGGTLLLIALSNVAVLFSGVKNPFDLF